MAVRRPLPPVQTGPTASDKTAAQAYMALAQSQYQAQLAASLNRSIIGTYAPRPLALAQPGPQHIYAVGETAGAYAINPALNIPTYDVSMIQRYWSLSPSEQLAVRWAIAFKPSWTWQELQDYRAAAFNSSIYAQRFARDPRTAAAGPSHIYLVGEAPRAFDIDIAKDLPVWNLSMIREYASASPSRQAQIRAALATKRAWTAEEWEAFYTELYRSSIFVQQFTRDPRGAKPGPFHAYQVGEMAGDYAEYGDSFRSMPRTGWLVRPGRGPAGGALAFGNLAESMRSLAAQARQAGDAIMRMRTNLPDLWANVAAGSNADIANVTDSPI